VAETAAVGPEMWPARNTKTLIASGFDSAWLNYWLFQIFVDSIAAPETYEMNVIAMGESL
jgi:hypothetical protein